MVNFRRLTAEDCTEIRMAFLSRTRKEKAQTLADLYRSTHTAILRAIEGRPLPRRTRRRRIRNVSGFDAFIGVESTNA